MTYKLGLVLALSAAPSCSQDAPQMRLTDQTTVHLDWTFIGGERNRRDRILLTEDGWARRNRGGNLAGLAPLTERERTRLAHLRSTHAPIAIEQHTDYKKTHPSAYRLRFDGRGDKESGTAVRDYAESVLARLAPEALLKTSPLTIVGVVSHREADGHVSLRVDAILSARSPAAARINRGDHIHAVLPDPRAGAGGEATVFALSEPTPLKRPGDWRVTNTAYVKLSSRKAVAILNRAR